MAVANPVVVRYKEEPVRYNCVQEMEIVLHEAIDKANAQHNLDENLEDEDGDYPSKVR